MKKIISFITLVAVMISVIPSAFAGGNNGYVMDGKIRVGVCADFKPFEYYDENGELAGFDIDLMKYIAQRSGFEVEFVNMHFRDLFSAVESGEIDCAISAITVTEERGKSIDFSEIYLETYEQIGENASQIVNYAVVFPGNSSEKEKLVEASGDKKYPLIYTLVNSTIKDMKKSGLIEKLYEKYNITTANYAGAGPMPQNGGYGKLIAGAEHEDLSATFVPCSDWAASDITKAKDINLIRGNYNFPSPVSREGFCELVYNYVSEYGGKAQVYGESKFTDTDNKKIGALSSLGIITGKSETEFAPNDLLTREEAAVILDRLIRVVHPNMASTELYYKFTDSSHISDWAFDSIQKICNMGIMKGVGNNNFAPEENYTTEQAIVTLVRVYANSGASKNFPEGTGETSSEPSFADKLNLLMPSNKNYMFSPLSVKMAFAMAANGADGNTKSEILNALDIDNLSAYNEYAKKLIESYRKADILKLDIANGIWLNKSNTTQKFSQEYQNNLKTYYNAELNSSSKDVIAKEINTWVKEKTNGKIDGIMTEKLAHDERFIMALLNAVYFKGAWRNEFDEKATKEDTFTDRDGNKHQIDFMNETSHYKYYKDDYVELLALPYKNRVYDDAAEEMLSYDFDISMYLVRGACSEETLSSLIENNKLESKRIALSIPKFESEFNTSLVDIMNKLGVNDAFVPQKAEFQKMFDGGNIYLMEAIHKTYIKVDEKGTEAAAVTGMFGGTTSMPAPPVVVKFNTPFTYIIRDDANGEILFMGEYAFAD